MRRIREIVDRLARSSSPVLVVGETGTGKELLARAIHEASGSPADHFTAVACGLVEDERFERTIAGRGDARRAEARGPKAQRTVFLDEVSDLPAPLQSRLLHRLDERAHASTGGQGDILRFIAATSTELEAAVEAGRFRRDLFFRLDVVTVRMPPLREHPDDIPLLVAHFLGQARALESRRGPPSFTAEAIHALAAHRWSGNVRELRNLVERLVMAAEGDEIGARAVQAALRPLSPSDPLDALAAMGLSMRELERRYMAAVLRQADGNKAKAAAVLGVNLSTLYRHAKHK